MLTLSASDLVFRTCGQLLYSHPSLAEVEVRAASGCHRCMLGLACVRWVGLEVDWVRVGNDGQVQLGLHDAQRGGRSIVSGEFDGRW